MTKNTKVRTHRKVWPDRGPSFNRGTGEGMARAKLREEAVKDAQVARGMDSPRRQQRRRAILINTKRRLRALRDLDAKANLEAIRAANALRQPKKGRREPQGGSTGITINRVRNWLKRHGR